MIEKWELAHFPFEKDPRRYKVRIRGSEEDLKKLIEALPVSCGRPFVTLSQDYNWAFYLYALQDKQRVQATEVLNRFSPNGRIIETPALEVGKELPPMLEDVLEAAAKNLLKSKEAAAGPVPADKPAAVPAEKPASPAPEPPKKEPAKAAAPEKKEPAQAGTPPPPRPSKPVGSLHPEYLFSEFVVGPNNRFTHAASQAVSENPGKIYNPFFIYGGVGLGKTHLMHAIGHAVLAHQPLARVLYVSTEKFAGEVVEAIRLGASQQLREQYRHLDLLLMDDVQFLSGSEATQEEFFHIFNALHELGKQIVITSDRPPKLLSTLEDRLRSRFEWGLITDLKPPNLETRIAILKKKAEAMKLSLGEAELLFIAERAKSNIRELEGILRKIHAYLTLSKQVVDLPFLKEMLGEPEPPADTAAAQPAEESRPPGVDKLAEEELARLLGRKAASQPAAQEKPSSVEPARTAAPASAAPPAPVAQKVEPAKGEPAKASVPAPKPPEQKPPLSAPVPPVSPAVPPATETVPKMKLAPIPETVQTKPEEKAAPYRDAAERPAGGTSTLPPVEQPPVKPPEAVKPAESAAPASKEAPPKPAATPASPAAPVVQKSEAAKSEPAKAAPPEAEEDDPSLRPAEVVCFYPQGQEQEYAQVRRKFREIIKKHKLKIRLAALAEAAYAVAEKMDYAAFARACRDKNCATALVLGPPPSPILTEDDFALTLNALMDDEKLTLQFVPWSEMGKDYRYLNCALDLSLSVGPHAAEGKGSAGK